MIPVPLVEHVRHDPYRVVGWADVATRTTWTCKRVQVLLCPDT